MTAAVVAEEEHFDEVVEGKHRKDVDDAVVVGPKQPLEGVQGVQGDEVDEVDSLGTSADEDVGEQVEHGVEGSKGEEEAHEGGNSLAVVASVG